MKIRKDVNVIITFDEFFFFVANSVNIHKKSLLGSVVIIKYCFLFCLLFFFVLKKKVNGR